MTACCSTESDRDPACTARQRVLPSRTTGSIGGYRDGALDNLAFNQRALNVNAFATWLEPKMGLELSASAGTTFNGENSDTGYETEDEFHLEFAELKRLKEIETIMLKQRADAVVDGALTDRQ
ncbi:MAG: transporter [Hyphomicrobiales bacterium]